MSLLGWLGVLAQGNSLACEGARVLWLLLGGHLVLLWLHRGLLIAVRWWLHRRLAHGRLAYWWFLELLLWLLILWLLELLLGWWLLVLRLWLILGLRWWLLILRLCLILGLRWLVIRRYVVHRLLVERWLRHKNG